MTPQEIVKRLTEADAEFDHTVDSVAQTRDFDDGIESLLADGRATYVKLRDAGDLDRMQQAWKRTGHAGTVGRASTAEGILKAVMENQPIILQNWVAKWLMKNAADKLS